MRSIVVPIILAIAALLSTNCLAASTTAADALSPASDYHPIPAGPKSDYDSARIKYIQRVAFQFRQNLAMARQHGESRIPGGVVQQPEATVRLYFSAEGKLEKYEITRGSGDASFDMAVGFVLQKSIPELPPAPVEHGSDKPFTILVRVCALC
jgi:hypothetical protein